MTARELAASMGLPGPTVHHLLNTLVDEGLVSRDGRRGYQLGPVMAFLGDSYQQLSAPPEALAANLQKLAAETGESSYLVGWHHGDVVIMETAEGRHAVRAAEVERGRSDRAHGRASGKMLLAFAEPDVRDAYLAEHPLLRVTSRTITDREEFDAALTEIRERGTRPTWRSSRRASPASRPIRTYGVALHGYSVSVPLERFRAHMPELAKAVTAAAVRARWAATDPPPFKRRALDGVRETGRTNDVPSRVPNSAEVRATGTRSAA